MYQYPFLLCPFNTGVIFGRAGPNRYPRRSHQGLQVLPALLEARGYVAQKVAGELASAFEISVIE